MSTNKTPFEQWQENAWKALIEGKMEITDFQYTMIVSDREEPTYKIAFAGDAMIVRINKNGSYTWIS